MVELVSKGQGGALHRRAYNLVGRYSQRITMKLGLQSLRHSLQR